VNHVGSTARAALFLLIAAALAAALTAWVAPDGRSAGKDGYYGMVVGPQVDAQRAIPKLGALGVHTVRLRMDVRDWGRPEANAGGPAYDGALQQASPLEKAGFRVVLQLNSEGGAMPSYERAKGLLEWLFRRPGAKSVDVLEMLGPVTDKTSNADAFSTALTFAEQARRYVDGPLRAAWDVGHDHRVKVLGAAFTPWQQAAETGPAGAWGLPVTKAYVAAGYLDRVDYAGFHPDQPTAKAQRVWLDRARAVLTGKPVWVSEWQLNREAFGSDGEYLDGMSDAARQMRGRAAVLCYAGFTQEDGPVPVTQGGLGGYREDDPAFDAYRDWPKSD
jgi:hypothetical protein